MALLECECPAGPATCRTELCIWEAASWDGSVSIRAEVGTLAPRLWLVMVNVSPPLLAFWEKPPLAISPYLFNISFVVTSESPLKRVLSLRTD